METVGIVLEATSFYAESGGKSLASTIQQVRVFLCRVNDTGQSPDKGVLTVALPNGGSIDLEVIDVQVLLTPHPTCQSRIINRTIL